MTRSNTLITKRQELVTKRHKLVLKKMQNREEKSEICQKKKLATSDEKSQKVTK